MLRNSDAGTEFTELAMLPFHFALNAAVALQTMAAFWLFPYRFIEHRPELHDQLVVPPPIEDDSERCLFA